MTRLKEHFLVLGSAVLLFLAWYARDKIFLVLTPFIWGVLIAFLLVPLTKWLEKKGLSTTLAVTVIYSAFLLVLALFSLFGIPPLWQSVQSFLSELPKLWENISLWIERVPFLQGNWKDSLPNVMSNTDAWGTVSNIGTRLTQFVVGLVLSAYFLKDRKKVGEEVLALLPDRYGGEAEEVYREVSRVFGAFIRGRFLLSLAVGILAWIALWIFRVPYAAAFGALFGLLDILPFFGPILAGIPVVALTLSQSVGKAILIVVVLFAIEEIEALFLQPKIMGNVLDMHPAVTILAVLVGAAFFGFFGMILAVPLFEAGKILIKRVFSHLV